MKIRLHGGATITDATVAMIKSLDNSDFSIMHTIIVPDRFSLQCEKLILETLPKKALFNVRVVNLTKFSYELLSMLGVKLNHGDVLTSGETLLLAARAIDNVAENFKTFKKGGIEFCHEVEKLISQFKSSGVRPEDLNCHAKGLVGNKYHDLALIYQEYEQLLGDKLDANARLALLNSKLKSSNILENNKIYFAQFDAFTKEGYNLIQTFAECADEVNISYCEAQSIGNEYIYEKDIFDKVKKLSQNNGVLVEVVESRKSFSSQKEAIIKGLYSYQKVKCENKGFYSLFSCLSATEEIESVAKLIRYMTYKGKRYKDIQIAVGGLSRLQEQIENIFNQYDIPYYIDSAVSADKTVLGNLIRKYFEVIVMGYSYDKMIDLLSTPLANDNQALIEKAQHLSIEGKQRYKKYIEKEFENAEILSLIEKSKTAKEFGEAIIKILSSAKEKHINVLVRLENMGELKQRNINVQIPDIIKEAVELINRERDGEISAAQYFKLLSLLLSFKKVSSVPTFVDGVFVGDATESYFAKGDTLIVMDAENLPVVSADNGLLSDDDLNTNFNSPIEPTIKMINRRNRFKTFSLLSLAESRLILFTQRIDEEGKKKEAPTYIKNLNEIFNQQEVRAGSVFFSSTSEDEQIRLLSAPIKINAESRDFTSWSDRTTLASLDNLVFKNKSARVTQIEQYFACPFKHFATYGLKLKEFEIQKFEPRDIGNLCHKGAELLLKEIIRNNCLNEFDKNLLVEFIDKNFNRMVKEENLTEKLDEAVEKDALVKFIKNQILILFENIIKELKVTSFKPSKIEYKFAEGKLSEGSISLIGKADRIDECGEYFRIIDYKTGTTGNILKELMFGQKLQLFLYQKFASEKFKKNLGGVFYFDARFDYSNGEEEGVVLKGVVPDDEKLIPLLDNSIEDRGKSEVVSIYKSKRDGTYKGAAISKVDINKLSDYAGKIAAKAINEIKEGYIQPKPHAESCRGCKYASLCGYEKAKGFRKLIKN